MKRVSGHWVLVGAFVLSIATLAFLSFAPMIHYSVEESGRVNMTTDEDVEELPTDRRHEVHQMTLPEAQGWSEVFLISGPLLGLTGLPILARSRRGAILLRGGSTILLFAGALLGAISFGIFYLLPAVLMLLATAIAVKSLKVD